MDHRPNRARVLLLSVLVLLGTRPVLADTDSQAVPSGFLKPYAFTTDWVSYHAGVWEKLLAEFKGRPDIQYLEIGVFEGRSLLWMLEHILTHPSAKATGVDIFDEAGYTDRFFDNLALSGVAEKVTTLKGYSQRVLKGLPEEHYDIIYIDGSHAAKDVMTDAVLSWQLLKPGGILIFDDYRWQIHLNWPAAQTPKLAIDAFLAAFTDELEVLHHEYQVAVRKHRRRRR